MVGVRKFRKLGNTGVTIFTLFQIVQLGPSSTSTAAKLKLGPKQNTKFALNHPPPPKTFNRLLHLVSS